MHERVKSFFAFLRPCSCTKKNVILRRSTHLAKVTFETIIYRLQTCHHKRSASPEKNKYVTTSVASTLELEVFWGGGGGGVVAPSPPQEGSGQGPGGGPGAKPPENFAFLQLKIP